MGYLENILQEIESEKPDFIHEIEQRIERLKKEGHIGPPNHLHFTVGGDVSFKVLMLYVLNTRGLNIYFEGKKPGNKLVGDCSTEAFNQVVVYTLDSLTPIVYNKYSALVEKFWEPIFQMFKKQN